MFMKLGSCHGFASAVEHASLRLLNVIKPNKNFITQLNSAIIYKSETPLNPLLGIYLKHFHGHPHPKPKALLALVLYLKIIHLTLYVRDFSVGYDKAYGHDIV